MSGPIDEVYAFWFEGGALPKEMWFVRSDAVDAEMQTRFGALVEQATVGELNEWMTDKKGRLALILLLDQFTRNIFRGTPKAFSGDSRALRISLETIGRGLDETYDLFERVFFYLPLEHAEDPLTQAEAVAQFTKLAAVATPEQSKMVANYLDYAVRHRKVVDRFGRFPHRNAILGRTSTPEESEFLKQPGSSF